MEQKKKKNGYNELNKILNATNLIGYPCISSQFSIPKPSAFRSGDHPMRAHSPSASSVSANQKGAKLLRFFVKRKWKETQYDDSKLHLEGENKFNYR